MLDLIYIGRWDYMAQPNVKNDRRVISEFEVTLASHEADRLGAMVFQMLAAPDPVAPVGDALSP